MFLCMQIMWKMFFKLWADYFAHMWENAVAFVREKLLKL